MIKPVITTQIEDGKKVYQTGDTVKVSTKDNNEYIGTISEIRKESFDIKIDNTWIARSLTYNNIDKICFCD